MNAKVSVLKLESTQAKLWLFGAVMALGIIIPSLGMPQYVTGPLVNALLILTVSFLGVRAAMSVGVITPLVALAHGVLPLPMMIMIPFIIVGNALLVVLYAKLQERGFWPALIGGALVKFLWLFASVSLFATTIVSIVSNGHASMPTALVESMTWPQLATAIAGGVIAWAAINGVIRWPAHR